jgi:hypothetical protein
MAQGKVIRWTQTPDHTWRLRRLGRGAHYVRWADRGGERLKERAAMPCLRGILADEVLDAVEGFLDVLGGVGEGEPDVSLAELAE